MELLLGGRVFSTTVNEENVKAAVKAATEAKKNPFVILGHDSWTYLQYWHDEKHPSLEYQDGDVAHHYLCTTEPLDLALVTRIFLIYLSGGNWKALVNWDRMDIGGHKS